MATKSKLRTIVDPIIGAHWARRVFLDTGKQSVRAKYVGMPLDDNTKKKIHTALQKEFTGQVVEIYHSGVGNPSKDRNAGWCVRVSQPSTRKAKPSNPVPSKPKKPVAVVSSYDSTAPVVPQQPRFIIVEVKSADRAASCASEKVIVVDTVDSVAAVVAAEHASAVLRAMQDFNS